VEASKILPEAVALVWSGEHARSALGDALFSGIEEGNEMKGETRNVTIRV
jgi:hypothetical protein